jgi:hypothetical protein
MDGCRSTKSIVMSQDVSERQFERGGIEVGGNLEQKRLVPVMRVGETMTLVIPD